MAEETVVVEAPATPAEPTEADASATLGIKPEATTDAPVVVPTQTAPSVDEATIKALMEKLMPEFSKQLTPLQRELGQFRKAQAEASKPKPEAYKPPAVWDQMPPETQKLYQDMFEHM